jgi:flavorubredoxin
MMAETIATELARQGVRDIVMHNVSRTHRSFILRDIFKYNTLILGSPTYNNHLFPEIEYLISSIEGRDIKNRCLSYFGSFTWAGAAVKRLAGFAEKTGWEVLGTPVEMKQAPNRETVAACVALAKAIGERIKINQ